MPNLDVYLPHNSWLDLQNILQRFCHWALLPPVCWFPRIRHSDEATNAFRNHRGNKNYWASSLTYVFQRIVHSRFGNLPHALKEWVQLGDTGIWDREDRVLTFVQRMGDQHLRLRFLPFPSDKVSDSIRCRSLPHFVNVNGRPYWLRGETSSGKSRENLEWLCTTCCSGLQHKNFSIWNNSEKQTNIALAARGVFLWFQLICILINKIANRERKEESSCRKCTTRINYWPPDDDQTAEVSMYSTVLYRTIL